MMRVAPREPVAVGVNVTLIVQSAPAARVLAPIGQVLDCEKSPGFEPVMAIEVMLSGKVPVFESVIGVAGEEDPSVTVLKLTEVVESHTAGAPPVPVRLMVWGMPPALKVNVAPRSDPAVGVNLTATVHVAPP